MKEPARPADLFEKKNHSVDHSSHRVTLFINSVREEHRSTGNHQTSPPPLSKEW